MLAATGTAPAYAAAEDTEPPTAPGPITVVEISNTSIVLAWAASTDNVGVAQYTASYLYLDFGGQGSTTTNSIRFDNLRPSGSYRFRVNAVDAAGNRSPSTPELFVTMPPGDDQPPTAPGQPVASEITATSVKLTWAHSVENIQLDIYEIFQVTAAGNTFVRDVNQIPRGPNETVIGGLTPGTTYTFVVRARDEADNYSAFSDPVTLTTLPATAPDPACTVRYRAGGQRPGGVQVELTIVNHAATVVDGWTLSWNFPADQRLHALRGATLVGRGDGSITVRNARNNGTIRPGGTAMLSYVASSSVTPTDFYLNSRKCQAG
ncbi:fibronectin type III domain-containing protein [Plantactinospora sp. S1510]|uniref:Fibronectin type III domain-containing protein n=1 Tax=Plantactinospora alkalitolerans TaxID=2789879 RepID=A0ABS0H800_9ACTN|nr:fibronectin type III domain-containing protein [Plantactinospora alkalitolerans]MBF9134580.1 fibronectin type III domain-containing protein [Plantactinospora alkalitolerans]